VGDSVTTIEEENGILGGGLCKGGRKRVKDVVLWEFTRVSRHSQDETCMF